MIFASWPSQNFAIISDESTVEWNEERAGDLRMKAKVDVTVIAGRKSAWLPGVGSVLHDEGVRKSREGRE